MASTRKPKRGSAAADLLPRFRERAARLVQPGSRITVALSGGVDSVVLLDLVCRLAARRRWRVSAVHVNHQLQAPAAQWASFCRRFCRSLQVPLRVRKVDIKAGNSLERAAREARYEVLARERADYVALAHNQDDQAETVLLHLFRGAGVRGLAGMKEAGELPCVATPSKTAARPLAWRPLLDVPRRAIVAYAHHRGLEWIEDPSNADSRFLRNFLRVEVLPKVESRVPAYREALVRGASHAAEAAGLLDELAAEDGDLRGEARALAVGRLRALSPARAKNVLRHFLQLHQLDVPSAERLEEALRQSLDAGRDAQVCVPMGRGRALRRERDLLVVTDTADGRPGTEALAWRGESELVLPEFGGVLRMMRARGHGISAAKLAAGPVTVRARRGGEKLRPDEGRPRRSVKNLLQEHGIPAWERSRMPFLYCGEQLVWVEGLGIDCAFRAAGEEPSISPLWVAAAGGASGA